jgi:tRNA(Ile)-lysidine synthase
VRTRLRDILLRKLAPAFRDLPSHAPLLVGVSGGRDSVTLLHLLVWAGFHNLAVCHLDHGLREDSAGDARFVDQLASTLGLQSLQSRQQVAAYARHHHLSIEAAGRRARHAFFAEASEKFGTHRVLLAHHADDQVETVLAHLLRGAGSRGLSAMRPIQTLQTGSTRLELVRPMLAIWRNEIDSLIAAENLPFREDPSNSSPKHRRNRIRHELLPFLDNLLGSSTRTALWRTAELLRSEDAFLESQLTISPSESALEVKALRALPEALQRRTLHRWLASHPLGEVSFAMVESVRQLLLSPRAKCNLPKGHHARRRAGKIWIQPPSL